MVTRRTRLLSAVAVVLMLVSMFTCFALPAIAEVTLDPNAPVEWPEAWLEDPSSIIAYKDRVKSDTETNDFAITDAQDWLEAVYDSNDVKGGAFGTSGDRNNLNGVRLWFTNDIDFSDVELSTTNPSNVVMSSYYKNASTAGGLNNAGIYGQGYAIKGFKVDMTYTVSNGNYKAMGLIGTAINTTIRDLTLDSSCSFTYRTVFSEAVNHYLGAFVGWNQGCTLINCRNEADVIAYDSPDDADQNSKGTQITGVYFRNVAPFGRIYNGGELINCSNTGDMTTNEAGYAGFIYDLGKTTLTIRNCFNTGTFSSTDDTKEGFFNTVVEGAAAYVSADNVYTVNTVASGGPETVATDVAALAEAVTVLDADAAGSGELAYLMNKNYAGYVGVDRQYYTVQGGETVVGTEADQTVMVQVYAGETSLGAVYASAGETVEISDLTGGADAETFVANSGVVNGTSYTVVPHEEGGEIKIMALAANEIYTGFLAEKVAFFAERNAAFYKDEDGVALTTESVQGIQNKLANNEYTTQDAINSDFLDLCEYSFDSESIVPFAEREKYPNVENYSVSSAAEMAVLSANAAELTEVNTLHIANDIDMGGSKESLNDDCLLEDFTANIDGGNHTISNMWLSGAWLNDYKGAYVKDLTFKNCGYITESATQALLIETVGKEIELNNITLDGVIGTRETATSGSIQSLLVAELYGNAAKLILRDITIVNSTMNRPDVEKYWNSGLVLGKTYTGVLDADGIYLDNNTLTGKGHTSGAGIVFGEIICDSTVKNVAVFNTTAEGTVYGVLTSMAKWGSVSGSNVKIDDVTYYQPHIEDPVITFENVIAMNNGGTRLVRTAADYPITAKVTNAYTDTANIFSTTYEGGYVQNYYDGSSKTYASTTPYEGTVATNAVADAEAAIASGEAAYKLNEADVEKQWAMDGAIPVFATTDDKAPVAVTFKALDAALKDAEAPIAEYTLYTDKDSKLIGLTGDLLDAASWTGEDGLATATFDADSEVIGYTTPAHDHQFEYTDNGDGTHDAVCIFSHNDAELGLFECYYQELGVAHEIEKKNVTDTNTAEPAATHQVVDDCKYCTYVSAAADCAGTTSEDAENSWETSCAGAGQTTTICDSCDYKHVKAIDQLEHTWGEWTHVDGTDTHKRTCANVANCGVADQVANCEFKDWAPTLQPSVEAPGEEKGTCECGNTDTRPIPALAGVIVNAGDAVIGETLEVAIELKNNVEATGLNLAITYNADLLTLNGAETGTWEDVVFDDNFPAASGETTTNFNLVTDSVMSGDGTAVVLKFAVKDDDTLEDTETAIAVEVVEAYDKELAPITFEGDTAEIVITSAVVKGDLTGDRIVNMADAILLLQYYTEKPQGETEWITANGYKVTDKKADLTDEGDGVDLGEGQTTPEVNINDVLYLLRYLNGWTVEL